MCIHRGTGVPQGGNEIGPAAGDQDEVAAADQKIGLYSVIELIRQKDFREMSWEEIAGRQAGHGYALKWRVGQRRTRRYQPRPARPAPICGRVVRDNLRHGGELLTLALPLDCVLRPATAGGVVRHQRLDGAHTRACCCTSSMR